MPTFTLNDAEKAYHLVLAERDYERQMEERDALTPAQRFFRAAPAQPVRGMNFYTARNLFNRVAADALGGETQYVATRKGGPSGIKVSFVPSIDEKTGMMEGWFEVRGGGSFVNGWVQQNGVGPFGIVPSEYLKNLAETDPNARRNLGTILSHIENFRWTIAPEWRNTHRNPEKKVRPAEIRDLVARDKATSPYKAPSVGQEDPFPTPKAFLDGARQMKEIIQEATDPVKNTEDLRHEYNVLEVRYDAYVDQRLEKALFTPAREQLLAEAGPNLEDRFNALADLAKEVKHSVTSVAVRSGFTDEEIYAYLVKRNGGREEYPLSTVSKLCEVVRENVVREFLEDLDKGNVKSVGDMNEFVWRSHLNETGEMRETSDLRSLKAVVEEYRARIQRGAVTEATPSGLMKATCLEIATCGMLSEYGGKLPDELVDRMNAVLGLDGGKYAPFQWNRVLKETYTEVFLNTPSRWAGPEEERANLVGIVPEKLPLEGRILCEQISTIGNYLAEKAVTITDYPGHRSRLEDFLMDIGYVPAGQQAREQRYAAVAQSFLENPSKAAVLDRWSSTLADARALQALRNPESVQQGAGKETGEQWTLVIGTASDGVNENKFNYIDRNGELMTPDRWFDRATEFKDGIATVEFGGNAFRIDTQGEVKERLDKSQLQEPSVTESEGIRMR